MNDYFEQYKRLLPLQGMSFEDQVKEREALDYIEKMYNELSQQKLDDKKILNIIKTFTILMTTDIERVSGVEFYKTNHLEIKFADYPKKAWCIDGEKLDRAVLNYEISNVRNVKIMMPKKNIDKIFVNKKV